MSHLDPLRRNNVTVTGNLEAAKTLVFVHGFGTDQTAWADVAAAFKDDYRIVLLDNVGAGGSDDSAYETQAARYRSLKGYADDLIEVGTALGLQDAVVVGHSVGAMIALLACTKRRGMFTRLVMLAGSPRYLNDEGYPGGFTPEMIGEIHYQMCLNSGEWASSFARAAMSNPERPELHEYFAKNLAAIPFERAASTLITILRSDHRADVARVTVPTLIIQTREDFAVPLEVAEYLHQRIQGSQLAVIDASGHLPHVSAPAKVIAAMRDFGL